MKEASLAEEEVATGLVNREIKRKKAAKEVTLQKAKEISQEIGAPVEQLRSQLLKLLNWKLSLLRIFNSW